MARARVFALPEAIEHVGEQLWRDALTRVLDGELGERVNIPQAHRDAPGGGGEPDRVREQIGDHLLQPIGIGAHVPGPGRELRHDLDALGGGGRPCQIERNARGVGQLDLPWLDLQLSRRHTPEIQQIVDHLELRFRAVLDPGCDRGHVGVLAPFERENAIPAENRVQGGTQLVRDDRQELVLRVIRRLRRLAQPALLLEQRAALALLAGGRAALRAHIARGEDQIRVCAIAVAQRATAERYPLQPLVRQLRAYREIDFRPLGKCSVNGVGKPATVFGVNALLELVPAELGIRRPAELRFELGVGAEDGLLGAEAAEAGPARREDQFQLVLAAGE